MKRLLWMVVCVLSVGCSSMTKESVVPHEAARPVSMGVMAEENRAPFRLTAPSGEPTFVMQRGHAGSQAGSEVLPGMQQWGLGHFGNDFAVMDLTTPGTEPWFSIPNSSGGFTSEVQSGGRWLFKRQSVGPGMADLNQTWAYHMAGQGWTLRDEKHGYNVMSIRHKTGQAVIGWEEVGVLGGEPDWPRKPPTAKLEVQVNKDAPKMDGLHVVGAPGQEGDYLELTSFEGWKSNTQETTGDILRVSRQGVRIGGTCFLIKDAEGPGWTKCTTDKGKLSCRVDGDGKC